jgi:hypothetical protein
VKIHCHDFGKCAHFVLGTAIQNRALGEDENIETGERRPLVLDSGHVRDIYLRIFQALKVRAFVALVVFRGGASAPYVDFATRTTECLGDPIANAAAAADDQHLLAGKVPLIHVDPLSH